MWQRLQTILVVNKEVRGGATDLWWVGAKDAAKLATVHGTALQQRSMQPNVSGVPDLSQAVSFTNEETEVQKRTGPKSTVC